MQLQWELLIPYNIEPRWRDSPGNIGTHHIDKGIELFTLLQLKDYFISKFYEEKQCHFIQLVDEFWKMWACAKCICNGNYKANSSGYVGD